MVETHDESQYLNFLEKAIHTEITRAVETEFEEAKKKAIEAIDRKRGEIIAGIVLKLEEQMSMKNLGREMIITIQKVID